MAEELISNYQIDLSITPDIKNEDIFVYQKFMDELSDFIRMIDKKGINAIIYLPKGEI